MYYIIGVKLACDIWAASGGLIETMLLNWSSLIHSSKISSPLGKKRENPDILNAIQNHTTGRPGMSLLEKIIFVADYIEPGRKNAPNLGEIRKLAFQDIDRALLRILDDTLSYLSGSAGDIDPMTEKTRNYYHERLNGEGAVQS